jgi:hypothetical protein
VTISDAALIVLVFAAVLFYAWLEYLWSWRRPAKGALDLDVESDRPAPPATTTDINFIEGKPK